MTQIEALKLPVEIEDFVKENLPKYPTAKAVLIPALMECQKWYGQITPAIALAISDLTGVPSPEVESVVSFYTMLLEKETGKYVLSICCTWNCEDAGAVDLVAHFKQKYSCGLGEVTKDGLFSMYQVECLADCHNAPSVQFLKWGREFKGSWTNNLTVELFDTILEDIAAGKPDSLRERLVRIDAKQNPPDDKQWVWIVTTNNQYAAWIEGSGDGLIIHDGFGKLGRLKQSNSVLHGEIVKALGALK